MLSRSRHPAVKRWAACRTPAVSLLLAAFVLACQTGCDRQKTDNIAVTEESAVAVRPQMTFRELAGAAQRSKAGELLADVAVTDGDLEILGQMPAIETLICDAGKVTDVGIDAIAGLPKLQHLRLRFSPITDAGLRKLATVKTLWFLNLPHSACTAAGISALADLPELRNLRLGSPRLNADAAAAVAEIESLQSVHLIGVPIDDDGLKLIARLPQLESIYLDDSNVTEDGWQWLFDHFPQMHVHVDQKHHDRDPHQH